jgi:large subunit ribosomal protein L29
MKAKDLRERTTEDLTELEKSIAAERFQSKFKNFTNRLDDTSQIRKAKRDLARVKLILGERARTAAAADKPVVAAPSVAASAPVTAASAAAAAPENTSTVAEAAPKRAPKKSKADSAPDAPAAEAPAAGTAPAKKAKSKSTEQGESK